MAAAFSIRGNAAEPGRSRWSSRVGVAVVASTLLTAVLALAVRFDPLPQGLTAQYFSNASWEPPVVASALDVPPSTSHLIEHWSGSPPETFSTIWAGSVTAVRDGTYTFGTISDAGASVFIDGQLVVDNGGRRDGQLATGSIRLASGAHPLLIRYLHSGGSVRFDLLWSGDGSSLTSVPAWALRPRRPRSQVRLAVSVLLDLSFALSEWIWVAILVLGTGTAIVASGARLRTFLERSCAWRPLRWILAGSLVLSLAGIWWGLPGSWVAIEVTPGYVLDAFSQHFSHGWFDAYPPFHFYLLTAVMSPMLLLNALGLVNLEEKGI